MKYLLLVAVVVAVLWYLRSRAKPAAPPSPKPPKDNPNADPAQPMVSCAHCGVHLPRAEAVVGVEGSYCSEAHQIAHGEPR